MVTLRKRARNSETPANPKEEPQNDKSLITDAAAHDEQEEEVSGYEQSRDKRIKENMERMQKLGIIDLSLKLKLAFKRTIPRDISERKTPRSSEPLRRSSRLQNGAPVRHLELSMFRKYKPGYLDDKGRWVGGVGGEKPEIYTEEHEKLLGTCKTPWNFFTDVYRGVYDSINGKKCHQCQRKTLGNRTHCSKCKLVEGQFCGFCLYRRYGENVLEANQNPNWICPVCRGICNCSVCRHEKGWVHTGDIYQKVSRLGYKSVAHFLIQTCRSQTNPVEDPSLGHAVSVKRSIPYEDSEGVSQQEHLDCDDGNRKCSMPQFEEFEDDGTKVKKVEVQSLDAKHDVSNSTSEGDSKLRMNHGLATEVCQDSMLEI